MITYIIQTNIYYKIGNTKNLSIRLRPYRTHNPEFKVVYIIYADVEKRLHKHFKDYHYNLEWYKLPIDWEQQLMIVISTVPDNEFY